MTTPPRTRRKNGHAEPKATAQKLLTLEHRIDMHDARLDRIDGDLRDIRGEVSDLRAQMTSFRQGFDQFRTEVRETFAEFRREMHQALEENRRHFGVLIEDLHEKIRWLAEGQAALMAIVSDTRDRVTRLEEHVAIHGLRLGRIEEHLGLPPWRATPAKRERRRRK